MARWTMRSTGASNSGWAANRIRSGIGPYTTLARSVNIHPTVAELVPTVLGELKPMA
jgi:hypothetical protein